MSDIYQTGKQGVTDAYNSGASAIGAFNPQDWAQQTQKGYSDLWNQQGSTQNQYIQGFKNQIAGQPQSTDYYQQGNDMYGVAPLKQQATQMNNAMLTIPQQNYDRSKGFNVDNSQIQQQTNQDLMRLSPLAAAATNQAQNAEQLAAGYAGAGMQQNQMNLQPFQQEGVMLNDMFARQASAFTTTAQSQLQALQDKMNQGVALSQTEMQQYAALTQSEQQYQAALNTANAQVKTAQIGQQYQTLNPSQTLVNTANGQYQKFR